MCVCFGLYFDGGVVVVVGLVDVVGYEGEVIYGQVDPGGDDFAGFD